MGRTVEPRYGAEVYVSRDGHVVIKQERFDTRDDGIIVLHPDEVPELVIHLESVRQEALDTVPELEQEELE